MQRIVNNIENLSKRTFTNVSEIESIGAQNGTIIVCISTNTIYQYVVNGEAYPVDGSKVLNTKFRGNTRWLGIGGQYKYFQDSSILDIYSDLSTIDASIISIDASIDNLYSIKQDASSDGTYVQHDGSTGVPDPDLYFDGDEWTDPLSLDRYKLYDDGTTKQWVQAEGYTQFYTGREPMIVEPIEKTESFTIAYSDINKGIRCNSPIDISCYVPSNADVRITTGVVITVGQIGVGTVKVMAVDPSTVTLNGDPKTVGQTKYLQIWKVAENEWDIIGGTT
jgi:hypothetical protein